MKKFTAECKAKAEQLVRQGNDYDTVIEKLKSAGFDEGVDRKTLSQWASRGKWLAEGGDKKGRPARARAAARAAVKVPEEGQLRDLPTDQSERRLLRYLVKRNLDYLLQMKKNGWSIDTSVRYSGKKFPRLTMDQRIERCHILLGKLGKK